MSIEQTFATTIQELKAMSLPELVKFKMTIGRKAFADHNPYDPDSDYDPDTDLPDTDDAASEYYDVNTESLLAVLDLCDQELERRHGRSISVTAIDE